MFLPGGAVGTCLLDAQASSLHFPCCRHHTMSQQVLGVTGYPFFSKMTMPEHRFPGAPPTKPHDISRFSIGRFPLGKEKPRNPYQVSRFSLRPTLAGLYKMVEVEGGGTG